MTPDPYSRPRASIVAAAPADDELLETGALVEAAALLDAAEVLAALVPLDAVEDGLPEEETAAPLAGSRSPQSAFLASVHSCWAVEFWVLAAIQFWKVCMQRKVGMVWR